MAWTLPQMEQSVQETSQVEGLVGIERQEGTVVYKATTMVCGTVLVGARLDLVGVRLM